MRVYLAESNIWRDAAPTCATRRLTTASPWFGEARQFRQPTSPASNPGLTSPAASGGRVVEVVLVAVLRVVVVVLLRRSVVVVVVLVALLSVVVVVVVTGT